MDEQQAQAIIKNTFESAFDKGRFTNFIKNLLNRIDEDSFAYQGQFIPDSYKPFISRYIRVGQFNDGENRIDILIGYLNKNTSIERARTMQRNFIAGYLQGKYGIPKAIEEGFIIEKQIFFIPALNIEKLKPKIYYDFAFKSSIRNLYYLP